MCVSHTIIQSLFREFEHLFVAKRTFQPHSRWSVLTIQPKMNRMRCVRCTHTIIIITHKLMNTAHWMAIHIHTNSNNNELWITKKNYVLLLHHIRSLIAPFIEFRYGFFARFSSVFIDFLPSLMVHGSSSAVIHTIRENQKAWTNVGIQNRFGCFYLCHLAHLWLCICLMFLSI